MKNKNNIDQLFKSKLNNQSFELKDSYMADFEGQLDVYNKKGKGLFWLFFAVASLTIGIVYDFVILPNFNSPIVNEIKASKSSTKKQNTSLKHKDNALQKEPSFMNSNSVSKSNSVVIENLDLNRNLETSNNLVEQDQQQENNIQTNSNKITKVTSYNNSVNKNTLTKTDSSIKSEKGAYQTTKENEGVSDEKDKTVTSKETPVIKTPDVYIDDTIRRQVFVVDTIIKKDTVIITDTIKRKFRLFKKKI